MEIVKKYSILYAEDNKEVQTEVVEYLAKYFKEVHVANDGKEALDLYAKKEVDVLLLDIDMPFIDGLDVAKEVRVSNKTIPIIMLTAFVETEKLLCAVKLHLCDYLVKPIDVLAFRKVMKSLITQLHEQKQNILELDDGVIWNKDSKKLHANNKLILLTQKEQKLLDLLIINKNSCLTFTDIMAKLWEDNFEQEVSIESVKLQVCFLRKKLPKNCIKNVYGKGYILNF